MLQHIHIIMDPDISPLSIINSIKSIPFLRLFRAQFPFVSHIIWISIYWLYNVLLVSSFPCNGPPAVKVILMALPTGTLSLSPQSLHTCGGSLSPSWDGRIRNRLGSSGPRVESRGQVRHPGGGPASQAGGEPSKRVENSTSTVGLWTNPIW